VNRRTHPQRAGGTTERVGGPVRDRVPDQGPLVRTTDHLLIAAQGLPIAISYSQATRPAVTEVKGNRAPPIRNPEGDLVCIATPSAKGGLWFR